MIQDSASLFKLIEKSRLLKSDELKTVQQWSEETPEAPTFLKMLVKQKMLTRWQAGQLLSGNSSFYLGKYKLMELLGTGGMGRVFRAEHTTMNRSVALKIIGRDFASDTQAQKRFLNEARAIAALNHPNIVHAYSIDKEGDRYYIVMEFVEGEDLEKRVQKEEVLDEERAARYILQVASALVHAHGCGMIHCDIKPANLLLNESDQIKVLDMGLARLYNVSEGNTSSLAQETNENYLGTVDYMAPEMAENQEASPLSDLYSLGCVFYFLLTGCVPFPGATLPERILKHQTEDPTDPRILNPKVSTSLSEICLKMMARQPEERYQSAQDVVEVLTEWLSRRAEEGNSVSLDFVQMMTGSDVGTSPESSGVQKSASLSGSHTNLSATHPSPSGKGKNLPETFTLPDFSSAAKGKSTQVRLPGFPGFEEKSRFSSVDTSRERTPVRRTSEEDDPDATRSETGSFTHTTKSFEKTKEEVLEKSRQNAAGTEKPALYDSDGNPLQFLPDDAPAHKSGGSYTSLTPAINPSMKKEETNMEHSSPTKKPAQGLGKGKLRVAKKIENDAEISSIHVMKVAKSVEPSSSEGEYSLDLSSAKETIPVPPVSKGGNPSSNSKKGKTTAGGMAVVKNIQNTLAGMLKKVSPKQWMIAGCGILGILLVGVVCAFFLGGDDSEKQELAQNVPSEVIPETVPSQEEKNESSPETEKEVVEEKEEGGITDIFAVPPKKEKEEKESTESTDEKPEATPDEAKPEGEGTAEKPAEGEAAPAEANVTDEAKAAEEAKKA
ncbi:MAG: serine/threonine-protein kinase, partial [Planctomycetia bacterium]|nr:serine/threonine-protein kinase [Planctomycetia bacterium]